MHKDGKPRQNNLPKGIRSNVTGTFDTTGKI